MIPKATVILFIGCFIVACSDRKSASSDEPALAREDSKEYKTAHGVLRHFPSDVKSEQAWYGHNYLVGDTPVIATATVPEDTLSRFIGLEVIVSGMWHPGEQWKPTEEESKMQTPTDPDGEVVIRGDGIKAASIKSAQ